MFVCCENQAEYNRIANGHKVGAVRKAELKEGRLQLTEAALASTSDGPEEPVVR